MTDGLDSVSVPGLIDPVDDPMISSTGAVESFELETKWVADPMRIIGEGTVNEFDSCEGYFLR